MNEVSVVYHERPHKAVVGDIIITESSDAGWFTYIVTKYKNETIAVNLKDGSATHLFDLKNYVVLNSPYVEVQEQ
jgi:hypothetical protein